MQRTVDMTVGSPTKHILKFSLPLIAANMGQQLYAIADASIVGRGVGVMALAAVGATDWIYCMILWTIIGLTQGFSTFVSRYFGEKDFTKVNKVIAMGSLLTGASGILLTVVSLLAAGPLLALMGTPTEIFGDATAYISIMAGGTVAIAVYGQVADGTRFACFRRRQIPTDRYGHCSRAEYRPGPSFCIFLWLGHLRCGSRICYFASRFFFLLPDKAEKDRLHPVDK